MLKQIYISAFLLLFGICASAQYSTSGSGTPMAGCNQFQITPNNTNQAGSMYSNTQVDLNTSFSLLFKVNFGCDNFGGEGMAFVFQPAAWTLGTGDYGLGYQGLTNTVAVEFDTRDNQGSGQVANWDIAGDHISIMTNGIIDHSDPACLTGLPLDPISTLTGDVEDCQEHLVEIVWTAGASQTITINVDGATSLTHTSNMITNNLGGNNMVTWGWTGATSIFTNFQTVEIALCPDFTFSATNCPGQLVNFTDNSINQYNIVTYDWDFGGFLLPNGGPTPSYTFAAAGNQAVTLTITDSQGCTSDTTIDVGIGFTVNTTADDYTICPNSSTILHVEGIPFVGNNCCFELHTYDSWSDGWGGTEVEVFVDGISTGAFAPPNLGGGGPHTEIFPLCFDNGAIVQLVVNGTIGIQPQESSVFLIDMLGDTMVYIYSDFIAGGTNWFDGATVSYTVDCGITPPAYTFLWDNAGFLSSATSTDPTATIPSSTTFTVDVTDPNTGCVISESVTVNTFALTDAVISGSQTVCQGNTGDLTITFTGSAPYDILINGPLGNLPLITGIMTSPYTLSVGDNGNYTIVSVTASGCVGTFSGTGSITAIIPPVVDIEADAVYCDGDVIATLNVISTNGGTVNWFDDAGLTNNIGTGSSYSPTPGIGTFTYYATETEGILGCVGPSDQVTITVNPVPVAPAWTGVTTYCDGDFPSALTGIQSLGGTMTWYDAPPPATILSSLIDFTPTLVVGTFNIYLTETANGCEGPTTTINLTVNPTPVAPVVSGIYDYCEGDTPSALIATPSLGGIISWENTTGTSLSTGVNYTPSLTVGSTIYWVYEELSGCKSDSTEITINVDPSPSVGVPNQVSICFGDSVLITSLNNGYPITWSTVQTGESVYLGPDSTTLVIVTATNPSCGIAQDSILVIVNPLPNVVAGTDTLIGIGGEVTLWATSPGNVTYTWIPDVNECISVSCDSIYDVPDQATVYVVFATDANGCLSTDSVLVDINGYMDVFVPNIFSPNGDGWNDLLEVQGPRLFNYTIQIYDRWGKKVFESREQKDYWDGTIEGKNLSPQTFVYMLTGETVLGDRISQQGNVSIIK